MNEPEATQHDLAATGRQAAVAADPDVSEELAQKGFHDAQPIGNGGFGVVYRCRQTELERDVAVKVLSSLDEAGRERFFREEQAMGRLSGHPNIVDVLQVGMTDSGFPFIVMTYSPHGSLAEWVAEKGPLGWEDTLRVGVKLAGAVESAHRAQVLHRDIKPANVLLSSYGEPQLTDFGIARMPGGFQTSSDLITGSPAFTAPEVLQGNQPNVTSDVYSLGATLFALLTGHAAFERKSGEKMVAQFVRITTHPIPDLRDSNIPSEVAAVIEKAMAHEPIQRPQTAYDLGERLRWAQGVLDRIPDEMALLDPEGMEGTASADEVRPPPTWPVYLRTGMPEAENSPGAGSPAPGNTQEVHNALDRLSAALAGSAGRQPPAADSDTTPSSDEVAASTRERRQAQVLTAADRITHDRVAGVVDQLADCLAHPDEIPAWAAATAANLTAYVHWCEFDFAGARKLQEWAQPYYERSSQPLAEVFGYYGLGLICYEQLDIPQATHWFERAYEKALCRAGQRSAAARVAASMVGEVEYRRGNLGRARELLDESFAEPPRVGPIESLITTMVTGARVYVARGEMSTAVSRLAEGSRIARRGGLERLRSHIRAERLRLDQLRLSETNGAVAPPSQSLWTTEPDTLSTSPTSASTSVPRRHGPAVLAAEAEEVAGIRELLVAGGEPNLERAVRRARALYARTSEQSRPRAQLDAALLLTESLARAGWIGEAATALAGPVAQCAELGWTRPLLDAGPGVTGMLHILERDLPVSESADQPAGVRHLGDIAIPADFLTRISE